MKKCLLAAGCLLALHVSLPAPVTAQSAAEIEKARLRGVEWLKGEQLEDGAWEWPDHYVGITSLCALALIENGVPVSDEVIEDAHKFVRKNYEGEKQTYDIALAIMFLSRVGDRDDRGPIRDLAARLVAGQNVEGGWHYSCPLATQAIFVDDRERPKPMAGMGDNSCTQFATLGLWIASRWGVDINDVMQRVGERFVGTQRSDGGWAYVHEKEETAAADGTTPPAAAPALAPDGAAGGGDAVKPSGPAMTYAGLFCLTVARATRIRAIQSGDRVKSTKPEPRTKSKGKSSSSSDEKENESSLRFEGIIDPGAQAKTLAEDPVFAKGLEMAGRFAGSMAPGSARYFLWSVERMGVILGREAFGTVNWFQKGSDALLKSQAEDGSWKSGEKEEQALADTSFAILFLRKANLGSDITRLLEGEPAKPFQIVSQESKPRFDSLGAALKAAAENDIIRVEGVGPFDMPHVEIDQSLQIEAAPGYTPVFKYEIGYSAAGKRSRPEDEEGARHMIRVNKGTLTLEGLALQSDPPPVGKQLNWSGVVVNGGTLRLLNCSVSESNKQGVAGLRITGPSTVYMRNSSIVCGRAGIEIISQGAQTVECENAVLFSKAAVTVVNGPKSDAPKLTLSFSHCAVQAEECFNFGGLTNPVDVATDGVAFKGKAMGLSMLPTATTHTGLSWTGKYNIYDVEKWVGSNGKANTTIKDAKTWNAFWGGTDENGTNRAVPFSGKRAYTSFNHAVRGDEFDFESKSPVYAYRRRTGVDGLLVGPGEGYNRFRESFDYRQWEESKSAMVAN